MTNLETLQLERKKHRLNLISSYAIYIYDKRKQSIQFI